MITQIISSEKCSNLTLRHQSHFHIMVETVMLSIILTYILTLNLSVVVITIWSAELRGCLFSMQLAATYVGNIFGGLSLIGNDIYSLRTGVLPICQKGVDHYSFLYFGISMNMIILLLNTRFRYIGVSNIQKISGMRNVRTRIIVLKFWIPTGIASALMCVGATLIEVFVIDYQFIISMGICVLPITFSVIWNGLLSRRLKIGRQDSKAVNRQESIQVLDRATFIINATIMAHSAFLFLCTIATVCSVIYYENESLVISLSWLLRLLYLLLFTIEGHVYLSKIKPARDLLKKKILHFLCCGRMKRTVEFEGEDVVLHVQ